MEYLVLLWVDIHNLWKWFTEFSENAVKILKTAELYLDCSLKNLKLTSA